MMKQCTKCKGTKGLDSFHKGNSKDGLSYWCKDCHRDYSLNRYTKSTRELLTIEQKRENKRIAKQMQRAQWSEERREMEKINKRLRRYNIDLERYRSLYSNSDSRCYACNRPESEVGTLNIDHDHDCCSSAYSCGDCVRGLLCSECNTSLGLMHESTDRIVGLMSYAIQYRRTGAMNGHAWKRMDTSASCRPMNNHASMYRGAFFRGDATTPQRSISTFRRPLRQRLQTVMNEQQKPFMGTAYYAWIMHERRRKQAHSSAHRSNRKELN